MALRVTQTRLKHYELCCTWSKLVVVDAERLNLQVKGVEGERADHRKSLLNAAHVGAAQSSLQVLKTAVADNELS